VSAQTPDSWCESTLGQLNQFSSRSITPAQYPNEQFELYSVPSFPAGEPEHVTGKEIGSSKQLVQPNDVLVCKINPRINRVWQVGAYSGERQIASSEWIGVRAPSFDSRYLRYFFSSPDFRELVCTDLTGVGGSLTRAQPKRVVAFLVPVAPRDEQKRIADKLDTVLARVDSCRERLDRVPAILKRFRQSVLAAATSGKLTEEWREENKVEDPWSESLISDLSSKVTDGEHITPKRSTKGRYLLSARNIQNGSIALDNVDYVEDAEFERIRKRCDPSIGDVLLSCSGSVGRVALVDRDHCYVMVRSAAMIRPKKELLNSSYLMYGLQSPYLQAQILEKSSATAQSNIFLGSIKSLILPLPQLPEQLEIVRRVEILFSYVDRIESRRNTASAQVDRLTPALLAKAFRGELVPQDPNDEPASVLLERIRSSKDVKSSASMRTANERGGKQMPIVSKVRRKAK